LEEIHELKNEAAKKQKYEEVASEMMETHRKELAIAQEQWEEDDENNRIEVTEDNC
jgi:hypothetical protein